MCIRDSAAAFVSSFPAISAAAPRVSRFPACPCLPQRTGGGETACGEGRGDWRGPLPPALSLLLAPALRLPARRQQGIQPVALPFQPGPPLAAPSRALAAGGRSGSPKSQTGRCPSPARAPTAGLSARRAPFLARPAPRCPLPHAGGRGRGEGGQRKRPLFPFGKKKSYKTTKIS